MKSWKLAIFCIFIFCIFFSCEQETNYMIYMRYDNKNNVLLISNGESAKIIKKIELDLQQDTLVINKVSKILVSFSGKSCIGGGCAIKLPSKVEFVKLGDKLYKLSDMNQYSHDDPLSDIYDSSILTVFPKKFPFSIK